VFQDGVGLYLRSVGLVRADESIVEHSERRGECFIYFRSPCIRGTSLKSPFSSLKPKRRLDLYAARYPMVLADIHWTMCRIKGLCLFRRTRPTISERMTGHRD